ncbi:MAG TPA: hypothetical protein DHV63_01030 [Pseudomonas sp.]|nr:hypothetical protein [Pseudomonas sp.]
MSTEQMREEFEAWARKHNESLCEDGIGVPEDIRLDRQGGAYIWANAESAWLAWQASRAALAVELPNPIEVHDSGDYQMDTIDALEAAGITVKP